MKTRLKTDFIIRRRHNAFDLRRQRLGASDSPYTLRQPVIASGGGQNSSGGTFALAGTIGQTVAGQPAGNSSFTVKPDFGLRRLLHRSLPKQLYTGALRRQTARAFATSA